MDEGRLGPWCCVLSWWEHHNDNFPLETRTENMNYPGPVSPAPPYCGRQCCNENISDSSDEFILQNWGC